MLHFGFIKHPLYQCSALSRVVSVNMGQIGNRSKWGVRRGEVDSLKPTLSAPTFDLYQDDGNVCSINTRYYTVMKNSACLNLECLFPL